MPIQNLFPLQFEPTRANEKKILLILIDKTRLQINSTFPETSNPDEFVHWEKNAIESKAFLSKSMYISDSNQYAIELLTYLLVLVVYFYELIGYMLLEWNAFNSIAFFLSVVYVNLKRCLILFFGFQFSYSLKLLLLKGASNKNNMRERLLINWGFKKGEGNVNTLIHLWVERRSRVVLKQISVIKDIFKNDFSFKSIIQIFPRIHFFFVFFNYSVSIWINHFIWIMYMVVICLY